MTRDDLRRILEKHRDTAYQGAPTIPNEAALDAMEEAVGEARVELERIRAASLDIDTTGRLDHGECDEQCSICRWRDLLWPHAALRGSGDE